MKTKIIKGYAIKSKYGGECLLYDFFAYRRDAVEYAQHLLSNQTRYMWKDIYVIVKVEMREI